MQYLLIQTLIEPCQRLKDKQNDDFIQKQNKNIFLIDFV